NLTVENISNFVDIPLDLAGEINSVGTIKGTLQNPQLAGKIAFSDGAFNGNVLPAKLAGNFDYDGSKFGFNTTAPDAIRVEASVPYPIIPGKSDRLTASANLDREAFVLLDALSQNYLTWVDGAGDVQFEATARLDLERKGIIYDLDAQGIVNLDNAEVIVETPFFSEQFIGTGKITLDQQIVNIETLDATFGDKDLSITGKLPILTAVNNLDNPLTINLPEGDIKIDKLYKGGLEGKIKVTGASLAPIIGGEVTLEDGKVSIPQTQVPTQEEAVQFTKTQANKEVSGTKAKTAGKTAGKTKANAQLQQSSSKSSFVTALDNFQVNLKKIRLSDFLYDFVVQGGLTLNGTVDDPSNIRPQGELLLTNAYVDLFSSSFNIARNRQNTIVFTPEAGILNPRVDIILFTKVENISQQDFINFRTAQGEASNEIVDPISAINSSQNVRISLVIDGQATDILPDLAKVTSSNCDIRPSNKPLVENKKYYYYTEAELNRFTECFNVSAHAASDRKLTNSPAVELTSSPSFSQGDIINLLGGQFIAFAANFSNRSQSQLFDLGVNKFILTPLTNRFLYAVEDTTVRWGKKIGLDYLTVFPNLEGIVEIDENSGVRGTYNYVLNETRVEYQRNF
ncbi:MAG: translocation/assembly module TamB domain-containing protein, partial [Waterburya sp.]